MDRVCINKITGRLIEMQSGGKVNRSPKTDAVTDEEYVQYIAGCDALEAMRLDTLRQNAINAGYQESDIEVKWVSDGELAALMAPTAEELAARMKQGAINAIQGILDAKAQEYGFDSIHTALAWIGCPSQQRNARAIALRDWGSAVWDFAEAEWEKQAAGTPTYTEIEAFIAALPEFVEPA